MIRRIRAYFRDPFVQAIMQFGAGSLLCYILMVLFLLLGE